MPQVPKCKTGADARHRASIEGPAVIRRILEPPGLWAPLAMQRSAPLGPEAWPVHAGRPLTYHPFSRHRLSAGRRAIGRSEHRSDITAALHRHRTPTTGTLIFLCSTLLIGFPVGKVVLEFYPPRHCLSERIRRNFAL